MGKGQLIRVGRGRYMLPEAEHSENLGLALVAAAVPHSVICLLSALRFHGIGTQAPHEVWIAVAQGAARPRLDYPPVCVTLVSGSAFTFGVERHRVDGFRDAANAAVGEAEHDEHEEPERPAEDGIAGFFHRESPEL